MSVLAALLFLGPLGNAPSVVSRGPEPATLTRGDMFPAKNYLIHAEAKKPKRWEILHVYVGPMELKGQAITGEFTPTARYTGSGGRPPPVAVGSGLFRDTSGQLTPRSSGCVMPAAQRCRRTAPYWVLLFQRYWLWLLSPRCSKPSHS